MTLAKHRNVVYKLLICFYEMFYRDFFVVSEIKADPVPKLSVHSINGLGISINGKDIVKPLTNLDL